MNLRFWLELLIRSSVIVSAGLISYKLSQNSSANFRHRLILGVFLLLLLLPVFSILLPEIAILGGADFDSHGAVTFQEVSARTSSTAVIYSINWAATVWLVGFGLAFLPVLIGGLTAWRIARRSTVLPAADTLLSIGQLPAGAAVLVADDLQIPLTCGVFRPKILLPAEAGTWTPERLNAVLLHEAAHVRRHDLLAQIVVHFIAAIWWFQPVVWILRRQLLAESEFACDAQVLASGYRPSVYATELLAVAKRASRNWKLSSSAIGMARSNCLEQRVLAILHPQPTVVRRSQLYATGITLLTISVAASAVTLQKRSNEQGGSTMKRTILSALLNSAGLSAATLSGYVHDSTGAPITDAKVSIYSPDNSTKQEAATDSGGKFRLTSASSGQYILRIERPGLGSILCAVDLKSDGRFDGDFTMTSEGTPAEVGTSIGSSDGQPKPIRVGGQVAESNLVTKVAPIYPAAAKQAGIQGTVEIATTISKEGVPVELRVMSSPSDDLSESALEAIGKWRYRPTLLNGNPVAVEATVVVNYTLSR